MTKNRLPVLAGLFCVLLIGFAVTSYGSVRFDTIPSPTEVITTGRSEVVGSINLLVKGTSGNVTGTNAGGWAQIGVLYTNPALAIDNTTTTGIKLFYSSAFGTTTTFPYITIVQNIDIAGKCTGMVTINIPYGFTVTEPADFIRLEGVRGRIDYSGVGLTAGTDFYADLQSINDPTANIFNPERVRVAKTVDGLNIKIKSDTLLLCFPTRGTWAGGYPTAYIQITEGFARAFVDADAGPAGVDATDRVDSGGITNGGTVGPAALGSPTHSTQFYVYLESIPASVSGIVWQSEVAPYGSGINSWITLVTDSAYFDSTLGVAYAIYSYQTANQTGWSDITMESFTLTPYVILKTGQTATGSVKAGVALHPYVCFATCTQPSGTGYRPRFLWMMETDATVQNEIATSCGYTDELKLYVDIIRCQCYLLFTYVTADSGWDTGIAVANTTGDTAVFGSSLEAPDQMGLITFYFYDKTSQYVGSFTTTAATLSGQSYVNVVSAILPLVTPTPLTSFSGYVIAKTQFQFCHALAFIADRNFAAIAHGYLANVIPDPAVKNAVFGRRSATDSGDWFNAVPAGESLNN